MQKATRLRGKVLCGFGAVVTAGALAATAAASYSWFFQGYLGPSYPQGRSVFSYNSTSGTQYDRITWNGHYLYGCATTITSGGTWNSQCQYTFGTDGDYERSFDPNTYNQAGCHNPEPQDNYWVNCHHDNYA
jgi:hypothetical protein